MCIRDRYDEVLLEKFFDDPDSISPDEIHAALRAATQDMSIIPMICGSSFKNKGVQFLLDAVCRYLPSPDDKEAIVGTDPKSESEISRKPTVKEPFSALAFKIATDPFVGRLAFFRAYSGRLDAGSYVLNNRSGNKERISRTNKINKKKKIKLKLMKAVKFAHQVELKTTKNELIIVLLLYVFGVIINKLVLGEHCQMVFIGRFMGFSN